MPVSLADMTANLNNAIAKADATPKFFGTKLTGNGKQRGLLTEKRNPIHIKGNPTVNNDILNATKRSFDNGRVTVSHFPFYSVPFSAWGDSIKEWEAEPTANLCEFAHDDDTHYYVSVRPHSLRLTEEPKRGNIAGKKDIDVCYQMLYWAYIDGTAPTKVDVINFSANNFLQNAYRKATLMVEHVMHPLNAIEHLANEMHRLYPSIDIDVNAYTNYIATYSLYDAISDEALIWKTKMDRVTELYMGELGKRAGNAYSTTANVYLAEAASYLHRIETYKIPLDTYRSIYNIISTKFSNAAATTLCKQNLNLLLNDTLYNLENNKPKLNSVPAPKQAIALDPKYSFEQRAAITTHEPLVLVQAGAGTGKSTAIIARINYMMQCGVDPSDITVISFTNAAADHISELNADVHSMTIASMIHTIYANNFPTHNLSSLATIINALEIYYPASNDVAWGFKNVLRSVSKGDDDAFTKLNNFIEYNCDAVMAMLDEMELTTLELEIVICYQQIEKLNEPACITSKHLIVDEVQDNSIFEFIYTLKYVDKHMQSLFIVGDCSQTLYEFRAAKPSALNVLEGSGVFATFALQTNYRSNQEILDMANVMLLDIEANQYAQIQLRANKLTPVTAQSFQDKVQLSYKRVSRMTEVQEALTDALAVDAHDFLSDCYNKHEQICFLAHSRRHVNHMQSVIERMFPNAQIVSLIPQKPYDATYLTAFAKRYWDDVRFVPSKSIVAEIRTLAMQHADMLINHDWQKAQLQDTLANWADENRTVIADWVSQEQMGTLTKTELLDRVRRTLIEYESRHNAIRSALVAQSNAETKNDQSVTEADFVFSTVHSAKGLEFPHVVLSMRADNDTAEDDKRLYYVGMTRAEQSEFIIGYGTLANPKLISDYETLIATYEAADEDRALQAAGAFTE